jgi:hypothetical protein
MRRANASSIRKSAIAVVVALPFFSAACGIETTEGELSVSTDSLVASTTAYEAEVLSRTASATGSQLTTETGASGGKYGVSRPPCTRDRCAC